MISARSGGLHAGYRPGSTDPSNDDPSLIEEVEG